MGDGMAKWVQQLLTPVVVVACLAILIDFLNSGFSSVDRRFDTLAAEISGQRDRADRVIESLGDVRADVATVRIEVAAIGGRVERIGDHVQVMRYPQTAPSTTGALEDALRVMQAQGLEFYSPTGATDGLPAAFSAAAEIGAYIVAPDGEFERRLRELGVELSPVPIETLFEGLSMPE